MKTYTEQDYFDALIRKYAPPAFQTHPTQDQLTHWHGHLPNFILRW